MRFSNFTKFILIPSVIIVVLGSFIIPELIPTEITGLAVIVVFITAIIDWRKQDGARIDAMPKCGVCGQRDHATQKHDEAMYLENEKKKRKWDDFGNY